MLMDASSGSFHSPELLRRPASVRMTGGRRRGLRLDIFAGVLLATARLQRSRSLTLRSHQGSTSGFRDGMSFGMAGFVWGLAIGRLGIHYQAFNYKEQAVSKEEILEAIQKAAAELGRAPSIP